MKKLINKYHLENTFWQRQNKFVDDHIVVMVDYDSESTIEKKSKEIKTKAKEKSMYQL